MIQQKITVQNKVGLHARPAAVLVSKAKEFDCEVTIENKGNSCTLKGVIGLMKLQCAMGDELTITCCGKEEKACMESLTQLIQSKFGED